LAAAAAGAPRFMALTGTFFVAKKSAADTCFDASSLPSSVNPRAVCVEGAVRQPQREQEILTFWDFYTSVLPAAAAAAVLRPPPPTNPTPRKRGGRNSNSKAMGLDNSRQTKVGDSLQETTDGQRKNTTHYWKEPACRHRQSHRHLCRPCPCPFHRPCRPGSGRRAQRGQTPASEG
jgi:hypothetical protein